MSHDVPAHHAFYLLFLPQLIPPSAPVVKKDEMRLIPSHNILLSDSDCITWGVVFSSRIQAYNDLFDGLNGSFFVYSHLFLFYTPSSSSETWDKKREHVLQNERKYTYDLISSGSPRSILNIIWRELLHQSGWWWCTTIRRWDGWRWYFWCLEWKHMFIWYIEYLVFSNIWLIENLIGWGESVWQDVSHLGWSSDHEYKPF